MQSGLKNNVGICMCDCDVGSDGSGTRKLGFWLPEKLVEHIFDDFKMFHIYFGALHVEKSSYTVQN